MKERLAATWPADVEEAVRCALSNGTLVCRIPTEAGSVKLNQDLDRESQRIRLAYLQTQVQRLRAVRPCPFALLPSHHGKKVWVKKSSQWRNVMLEGSCTRVYVLGEGGCGEICGRAFFALTRHPSARHPFLPPARSCWPDYP